MVKFKKWVDYLMLILSILVIAAAIMILINFIIDFKPDDTNSLGSGVVLGLAFMIIVMTFMSATILLIPVALYFIRSIYYKNIISNISNMSAAKRPKFPFTKILLNTLYISLFITILISSTSFEVMLEAILTHDKLMYILRSLASMLQNIMVSVYMIFIIDYLKNKLREEESIGLLIDSYNKKKLDYKIDRLDNGRISATINATIASAIVFVLIFLFRLADGVMNILNGGDLIASIGTISIYTELALFFLLEIYYFKYEKRLLDFVNGLIDKANED